MSSSSQPQSHLTLRSYKPTDYEQVDYIFYSTYFSLVPEGVKQKLKSPLIWIVWLIVYGYLLSIAPVVVMGMTLPSWVPFALQIFLTFAWTIVSFAGIFVLTDRLDTVEYIEKVRQNDLRDPEVYYMNMTKEERIVSDEDNDDDSNDSNDSNDNNENIEINENNDNNDNNHKSISQRKKKRVTFDKDTKPATELIRTLKPIDQQTKSHFWVLQMDNHICGMIGLIQYNEIQYDQRPLLPPGWKKIGQLLCERYHLSIPSFLQFDPEQQDKKKILAQPHSSNTHATLQRLAVKQEFQSCGLSTLLINRCLTWAYEQGITQVFAVTNEMQSKAAQILQKNHQFTLVKKEKKNWLGKYECTWVCDVQQWHNTHREASNMFKNN